MELAALCEKAFAGYPILLTIPSNCRDCSVAWPRVGQRHGRFGDIRTVNKSIFSALSLAILVAASPGHAFAEDAAPVVPAPAVQTPAAAAAAAASPVPAVTAITPDAPAKPASPAKAVATPDAAKAKVVKPKANPPAAKAAAGDASEKLPWATGAKPVAGAKPAADKAKAAASKGAAAEGPLSMACPGLYEAACREVPACTWIADVKLQTGADVKAHCVDRNPQAAKKDAGAKKVTDKPKAPAVPKAAQDAVVKAAPATAPAAVVAAPAPPVAPVSVAPVPVAPVVTTPAAATPATPPPPAQSATPVP